MIADGQCITAAAVNAELPDTEIDTVVQGLAALPRCVAQRSLSRARAAAAVARGYRRHPGRVRAGAVPGALRAARADRSRRAHAGGDRCLRRRRPEAGAAVAERPGLRRTLPFTADTVLSDEELSRSGLGDRPRIRRRPAGDLRSAGERPARGLCRRSGGDRLSGDPARLSRHDGRHPLSAGACAARPRRASWRGTSPRSPIR